MMASCTGPGTSDEPAEGQHAGQLQRLGVDGVDGAGEAAFNDVLQQLVPRRSPTCGWRR